MSDQPETKPIAASAIEDGAKSGKAAKPRKLKSKSLRMEYNYSGRLSSLKLIGANDATTEAHFQLKGKKNRGKIFTLSAGEPLRFSAAVQMLSAATARSSRLNVQTAASDSEFRAVTQLALAPRR